MVIHAPALFRAAACALSAASAIVEEVGEGGGGAVYVAESNGSNF